MLLLGITYTASNFASISDGILIYQKNVHLSVANKKLLSHDILRYRNAENLWDTLREQFKLPHLENHPAVQEKISWYLGNQEILLRAASRAAPYLYFILQEINKKQLPAEMVLIPIIESGYNPFAISNMGASGLWQMMPDTASGLGIQQDSLYDGRRDIITSTRAALNHLMYLQNFFDGNWLLALAAYNTGEGNVLTAIKRNIRQGKRTDFWSLSLAQQTKDYVPSLLALAAIISHPEKYQLYLPPVRNAPYLAQIDIGKQINLKYAAALAGINVRKIMQLNPGFNQYLTAKKGPFKLILPIENVIQFSQNFSQSSLSPKFNWFRYKVRPNDTLLTVSAKFNVEVDEIRKFNQIKQDQLKVGAILLIPDPINEISEKILKRHIAIVRKGNRTLTANNLAKTKSSYKNIAVKNLPQVPKTYHLQPGDTVYMIRKTDTVISIANKFHISPEQLILINSLTKNNFSPGKQIIIPTHKTKLERVENKFLRPSDTIHIISKGDTFKQLAEKYHTSEAKIRLLNLMTNRELKEGERLVIPEQTE